MVSFSALIKLIGGLGAIIALSLAGHAFLAANTVPASHAGDGSGAISGFTVSAVHYVLNSTTPSNLDSLTFTISPAPATVSGTVKVKTPSTGAWITCGVSGTTVTCPSTGTLTGVTVTSLDSLEVVAAD
jgi:hypothetical protein